jgi:hypothetical protein
MGFELDLQQVDQGVAGIGDTTIYSTMSEDKNADESIIQSPNIHVITKHNKSSSILLRQNWCVD